MSSSLKKKAYVIIRVQRNFLSPPPSGGPFMYIIVFLGVVWITVLVFCQFKQKTDKKSPIFLSKSTHFLPLNHFCKGFCQRTRIDRDMTKSPLFFGISKYSWLWTLHKIQAGRAATPGDQLH